MLNTGLIVGICSLFFFIFSLIIGYLLYKINKISAIENSVIKSSSKELELDINKIEERLRKVELKQPLAIEPRIPGERGPQGEQGPPGRTLIQDINELFDAKDEIEVFKRIQKGVTSDLEELENIASVYSDDNARLEAIEKIHETLTVNAKNLYGISKLRKLKKETSELCKDVMASYEKYIKSFAKLHKSRELSTEEKMKNAEECKIDLRAFQHKIDKFNENLDIITQKKREFFLGEKIES